MTDPASREGTPEDSNGEAQPPAREPVRLQKVLAQAGVASRRASEDLIAQGRVEVDGKVVRAQGVKVDPVSSIIRVDGTRIVLDDTMVYLALNKPKGMHSTMSDEFGRPCIGDLIASRVDSGQRLFHVGRLDADTEGLILVTNDGELAHRLMHPSYEIPKTYIAQVNGVVEKGLGKKLRAGIELDDGPVKADHFSILDVHDGHSLVQVVLHEGRKHIVRRLLAEVGYPVERLVRVKLGGVNLGDQRPSTLRKLGRNEISDLYTAVDL
ncbi:pseudouridine synthase [Dietzia sp.]|uniref:pseudouridine synthase n=1 Tax=Dietzia sp. TaxID=1871616 RepID=UPI002FDA423B